MIIDCVLEEVGAPERCRWRRVTVANGDVPNCMFWYPGRNDSWCEFAVMECDGVDMLGLVVEAGVELVVLYCFDGVAMLPRPQFVMMSPRFELSDPNCFQRVIDSIWALVKSGDYVPLPA